MIVKQEDVVSLVSGLLSDPGTSSKDHTHLVSKAIDLAKEIGYQVERSNKAEKLPAPPATAATSKPVASSPAAVKPVSAK